MKKQVLLFVLMLMPLMASAYDVEINGIFYNLNQDSKQAEVTYYSSLKPSYTGSIVIPKTVVFGGRAYSVTSIDWDAFNNCSSLTSVTIPNSVTSIGGYAFYFCSSLTSITIPNSVTSIGDGVFSGCSGLTSIIVENGNTVYDSRQKCNAIIKTSTNELIAGCKSTIIPNSVTSIGEWAFSDCSGLTSITIPKSVKSIGPYTFGGCTGLNSVHITDLAAWCNIVFNSGSEGLEWGHPNPLYYAHHLFLNGEEVKELVIPDGVTSIGSLAFSGCSGLTSVTIPNSVTSIGSRSFSGCSSLTSITIPNSVTSIGWDAFNNCSSLTSVTIPNSVTSIGSSAFYRCSGLTSITIPNSVTSIGDNAFYSCSGLTSITIPNSVTTIKHESFSGCFGLTSLTIPNSVTTIGNEAFRGCSGLTSVTIPNSVTSIGSSAFYSCSGLTSITIPNSVTSIGNEAFSGCSGLTSLTISNSVTSIESSAFNNCLGLTSLTIPNSVTSIGNNAFQGCSKLSSVSIGSGINSIGSKAFANCTELKEMYCYAIDVPTISSDTFQDTNYIKWGTLYVPEQSVELYKKSIWSQYFGNIVGISGGSGLEKCAKPIITLLANGKIKVESSTEGATCVTNITTSNAEPLTDGEISLNTPLTVYTVTSYATKEGYNDSEVATATFRYEKTEGDMNGDGTMNISDVIHLVNMILGQ